VKVYLAAIRYSKMTVRLGDPHIRMRMARLSYVVRKRNMQLEISGNVY